MGAVERQRQWRRRPVCTHGRATVAVEEAGSSGVDDGGGDQCTRERAAGT
jgi:hypothetical protein